MSDKYILRSGAIDAIKRNSGTLYTREAEFLFQKVISLLKNAPAADVAEVVRCRDCEYLRPTINVHTGKQSGIWCALHDILNVSPDDYCRRGEKKGGRPCD